ncbi:MAG: hypothetical protein QXL94_01255 [Candidatus Parvarchaeum sp.]
MKVLFPEKERHLLKEYEDKGSALDKLLFYVGPVISEAILNFYAKSGDKEVYRRIIDRKKLPYFSSYIHHFDSLENDLKFLVQESYKELQGMNDNELEEVYNVLDHGKDPRAESVLGEKYNNIMNTRNKILKDEVDLSSRLPKLNYLHSINANYAYLFGYNFKKDMDPRKVKSVLYKKTLKAGNDPKIYTDFSLFSLRDKTSIALAFYGRAIEFTDFMDMLNLTDYRSDIGNGKNILPWYDKKY